MGKSSSKNPMVNQPETNPGVQAPHIVRPRDSIQDWEDPYLPDGHRPDGTLCKNCGAVYENQHWLFDDRKRDRLQESGTANTVICPACRKVADRNPHGIVTLSGDYWPRHRDDIVNLIRNEERRAWNTNALERIIDIREEDDSLVIETTNEKLAQRIGREIEKAHKGDIEYQWPDSNRMLRVYWERSLSG